MKRKNIEIAVLFGLIAVIVLSLAKFDASCEELRQNVLRLHIIANSDSDTDQDIKLAVRDAILKKNSELFSDETKLSDAINSVSKNLSSFEDIANTVLEQNGLEYKSNASVGISYFENREYDDFTLPAGNYESLIIKLGEGKGKNWWCVVFPSVCVGASSGELSDSVSEKSADIAQSADSYVIRFKAVEVYEDIKHFFSKANKK